MPMLLLMLVPLPMSMLLVLPSTDLPRCKSHRNISLFLI